MILSSLGDLFGVVLFSGITAYVIAIYGTKKVQDKNIQANEYKFIKNFGLRYTMLSLFFGIGYVPSFNVYYYIILGVILFSILDFFLCINKDTSALFPFAILSIVNFFLLIIFLEYSLLIFVLNVFISFFVIIKYKVSFSPA